MKGEPTLLNHLISKGANVAAVDSKGNSSLHWATRYGHLETVRVLMEKIPIDSKNNKGETPALCVAKKYRYSNLYDLHYVKIVEYLLENGADSMERDEDGNTGLHKAAKDGDIELLQFYMGKVPVDCLNSNGETPVMLAGSYISEDRAKRMLQILHSE